MDIIRTVIEIPDGIKKRTQDIRSDSLAPPPLKAFRRLEPLGFGVYSMDGWVFHPDECPPDLVWPMDVGVITDKGGSAR